jgi:hypothetical protein
MLTFANTLILINNIPAIQNIVAQKKAAVQAALIAKRTTRQAGRQWSRQN